MNPFLNHKSQAFYLTILCFLPLAIGLFWTTSLLVINPSASQNSFTLSMKQFAMQSSATSSTQSIQQPLESLKPIPKDVKHKNQKHKKRHQAESKPKPIPQTMQTQTAQASQDSTNAPSQDSTHYLSYGKDDNPFLRAVKSSIDKSLDYPRKARKMRMQGEVVVGFLWTTHKQLKNLKVLKSSGYDVLDENALQTIQKASAYFPIYTNNAHLQIPIIYRLTN